LVVQTTIKGWRSENNKKRSGERYIRLGFQDVRSHQARSFNSFYILSHEFLQLHCHELRFPE
jgi:hypothetical protein